MNVTKRISIAVSLLFIKVVIVVTLRVTIKAIDIDIIVNNVTTVTTQNIEAFVKIYNKFLSYIHAFSVVIWVTRYFFDYIKISAYRFLALPNHPFQGVTLPRIWG